MAIVRGIFASVDSIGAYPSKARANTVLLEATLNQVAKARASMVAVEAVITQAASVRSNMTVVEALQGGAPPKIRSNLVVIEVLLPVLEARMATALYPTSLLGLSWDVTKKPKFNNKVAEHVSGKETRTSYWQNPRWEYTVTYEYLPDIGTGQTDLKTLLGFFLARKGDFDAWLFTDPDDNTVTAGYQTTFDGVTTQFDLVRSFTPEYYEPIGQYNTGLQIWLQANEAHTIPASPGPYTVTVNNPTMTALVPTVTVGGTALTLVAGAPAAGQFSYVQATGVFTFNSAQAGAAATINYQWLVPSANYSVTMPRTVVFTSSPPAGAICTASFQYYFVCRFLDPIADFNKFANQLWELKQLNFTSLLI
jgi:hypothetical protein